MCNYTICDQEQYLSNLSLCITPGENSNDNNNQLLVVKIYNIHFIKLPKIIWKNGFWKEDFNAIFLSI
jgi:hypothetical protein